jgi:hypothetical protein
MGKIYSYAEVVHIWLGPENGDSNTAMSTLSTFQYIRQQTTRFVSALEQLLGQDWFVRVWVAQELALASRDPTISCGPLSMECSKFASAIQAISTRIQDLPSPPDNKYCLDALVRNGVHKRLHPSDRQDKSDLK